MTFLKEFEQFWIKNNFPNKNHKILIAVSGGIDSMALCHILYSLNYQIQIAHCNFQLRGDASNADEALVRQWATEHQIPFHCVHFDTNTEIAHQKKGVQEVARNLRYQWFKKLQELHQITYIATAHHANDNVETLFINLSKGTGISGMHGIPCVNEFIIRPLLFATRKMIENFVIENNIPYREDQSNLSDKYLRNKIRHHIIPLFEKINPLVVKHINESIFRFADAEKIYNKAVEKNLTKLMEKRGEDVYIPIKLLLKQEGFQSLIYEISSRYNFTAHQTNEILKLIDSESGHYVVSNQYKIIKNRDFLIVTALNTTDTELLVINTDTQNITLSNGSLNISHINNFDNLPTQPNTACVAMQKLDTPLIIRRWKQGDYFYPFGMKMKKKKLSKFFIDLKIPLHEKNKIWVLESNKKIVWLIGLRMDERFKINNLSNEIVKFVWTPNNIHN